MIGSQEVKRKCGYYREFMSAIKALPAPMLRRDKQAGVADYL